jgi:hypothetical protein
VRRLFFSARVAFATLVSGFQNSRYFPNEISIPVWYIPEAEEIRREWARSIIQKVPTVRARSIHRAQTNAFTINAFPSLVRFELMKATPPLAASARISTTSALARRIFSRPKIPANVALSTEFWGDFPNRLLRRVPG